MPHDGPPRSIPPGRRRVEDLSLGGLVWSADFDSGNLAHVEQRGEHQFTVWARADCEGTPWQTKSRTWFCFSIRGAEPGRELMIDVIMTPQKKLYEHGMRPVYRSLPSQPTWARVLNDTPCKRTPDGFTIQLQHVVNGPAGETLYFAFCYPYSYGDCMARLAWLDTLFAQPRARLAPGLPAEPPPQFWVDALQELNMAEARRPPEPFIACSSLLSSEPDEDEEFKDVLQEAARQAALESSASGAGDYVVDFAASPAFACPSANMQGPPPGPMLGAISISAFGEIPTPSTLAMQGSCDSEQLSAPMTAPTTAQSTSSVLGPSAPAAAPLASSISTPAVMNRGAHRLSPSAARANAEIAAAAARECAANFTHIRPRGHLTPGDGHPNASLVYYQRELLCRSLDGRRVDLITITGHPHPPQRSEGAASSRPRKKGVVLLTARVHPGETPASHVIDGVLRFLLRPYDPRVKALRDRFIFKLVPMLNPDGVYHGHYRADTQGINLNRKYSKYTEDLHPTVAALMRLSRSISDSGDLALFIDIHAHAGRRGCFFYGTDPETPGEKVESQVFAKLVSLNTQWLDYELCNWFAAEGQDGSARSAIYAATLQKRRGVPFIYTLECNYDSGVAFNELAPRHAAKSLASGHMSPEPQRFKTTMGPKYSPESWQDVGKAIVLALLDFHDVNPHSRLGPAGGGGLPRLRTAVSNALAKYEKAKKPPRPPKDDSAGEDDGVSSAYETTDEDAKLATCSFDKSLN